MSSALAREKSIIYSVMNSVGDALLLVNKIVLEHSVTVRRNSIQQSHLKCISTLLSIENET